MRVKGAENVHGEGEPGKIRVVAVPGPETGNKRTNSDRATIERTRIETGRRPSDLEATEETLKLVLKHHAMVLSIILPNEEDDHDGEKAVNERKKERKPFCVFFSKVPSDMGHVMLLLRWLGSATILRFLPHCAM